MSNHIERDNRVAGGFGHLLAVLVAHQGVQIHVAERHLVHEVQAYHPRHPEEEDVEAGDQHRGKPARLIKFGLLFSRTLT